MDAQKVDMFMIANKDNFPAEVVAQLKEKLLGLDESKFNALSAIPMKSPMTSLILAWFSVDRFYLGQTGLGVAKLLTAGGCGIWSLIDLFTAMKRTKEFNYNAIQNAL